MENSQLKLNAKAVLKTTYWMSFLATFIFALISGVSSYIQNFIRGLGGGSVDYNDYIEYMSRGDYDRALESLEGANQYSNPGLSTLAYIVGIAITIFVLNIISVGLHKLFINARKTRKADLGDMFSMFSSYTPVMKTMFFYDLYIWLWSLLFLIPGIVKMYSYYMVPYIIAENPGIDTDRAFEISKRTMDGEKGKAFYMHLSFIGWYLLGLLACCIGIYFVTPYAQATYTEFYAYVKQKSLATGVATPADYGEAVV